MCVLYIINYISLHGWPGHAINWQLYRTYIQPRHFIQSKNSWLLLHSHNCTRRCLRQATLCDIIRYVQNAPSTYIKMASSVDKNCKCRRYVVAGGGIAGVTCAEQVRNLLGICSYFSNMRITGGAKFCNIKSTLTLILIHAVPHCVMRFIFGPWLYVPWPEVLDVPPTAQYRIIEAFRNCK